VLALPLVKKYYLSLLAIILIALALQLYNLTYHSLWFDEAISVHWAKQSISRILEVGFTLEEDRLPPLYYLMLKGWTSLFGFSEASVRGLSVLFGLLLLPVVASIAKLLFNRPVALIAAALVALNPFLIWYAQEARMYAPALFFGTVAIWAFLRFCQTTQTPVPNFQFPIPNSQFIILFILATIAGLYSHLYVGFLLPALGLWLVTGYPRHWRLWLIFTLSGLVITLAYSPILLAIWRFSGQAAPGTPFDGLLQRGGWLLQAFTVWQAPLTPTLRLLIPALFILFVALAFLPRPSPAGASLPYPRLLASLLFICPFAIATLLLFRNHLAFFGERYFIVMVPWLLIMAARGIDTLSRWLAKTRPAKSSHPLLRQAIYHSPFIILLLAAGLPIPGLWSVSTAKEGWRQSVDYLAQNATRHDAILIHPDWIRYPFQYYFQGPGQTYAAFSTVTPETALDGPLRGVVGNHEVIWLIQSHIDTPDPNRRVEQWLAARYPLVTELFPPGITLKGYAANYQLDTLPPEATPVDLPFENGLRLVGYRAGQIASATDTLFHPPSGWVHVTLYWTANRPVTPPATPFVHLVGPQGVWGVSLDRPNDALKLFPPSRWPTPAPIIRQDLDVNLNPATPPGVYQLVVGMPQQDTQYPLTQVRIR